MKINPEKAAVAAGLRYVHDDMPGIRRRRWGKGFSYILPSGDRLSSSPKSGSSEAKIRNRIDSLAIPPNWEDTWICLDPNGHLQSTGRDGKGRKQYRYHPEWRKFRNLQKFDKMVPFGECLPELRSQTASDLKVPRLSRRKVTAAAVQLLDRTLIRVGNAQYAQRNKSYGLTTLRDRHVDFDRDQLNFHFVGKSGIEHDITIEDPRLAKVVRACRDIPGYELFQYYDEAGYRQTLGSGDVNDYLKRVTGEDFTAKDFRTWAGTVVATDMLAQLGDWAKESEAKSNVVVAIKAAAAQLGNRPATCRKYYVHPTVPENYLAGDLLMQIAEAKRQQQSKDLQQWLADHEQGVLGVLKLAS
ncbi:MAG: DNA topoisomerase IB [Cyanobacteria bacterium P01_C01_bin.69]